MDKHSSLFPQSAIDEVEKFYKIGARKTVIKKSTVGNVGQKRPAAAEDSGDAIGKSSPRGFEMTPLFLSQLLMKILSSEQQGGKDYR